LSRRPEKTMWYTTVYDRIRWLYSRRILSYTTRRITVVFHVSSIRAKYDRIRSGITPYTTVNDRIRRRKRSFTGVVMFVLGIDQNENKILRMMKIIRIR